MDFNILYIGAIAASIGIMWSSIRIGMWLQKVNTGVDTAETLKKDIADIKIKISRIIGHIFGPEPAIAPGSPLTLTDHGNEIAEAVHAKEWAKFKAPQFSNDLAHKEDYEIENFCFGWVHGKFADSGELGADISKIAYELGSPQAQVYDVLAAALRSELISLRAKQVQTT